MAADYKAELQKLLRDMFQFDHAELDFGIYRIMNQKRSEVERFIQKDLIEAVDDAFKDYEAANRAELERELEELKKQVRENIGPDVIDDDGRVKEEYGNIALVKRYRAKKAEVEEAGATDTVKAEVFSHIYHFFNRYYDEGDFLSLRRYSRDYKYVVPYNGEEVVLHWANKDQYYIKTTENFYNYSFKAGERRVHFRIAAAETEKNNVKGEKRFFFLKEGEGAIVPEEGELTVYFEYRAPTDEEKTGLGRDGQKKLVDEAKEKILAAVDEEWRTVLSRRAEDDGERSVLEKNLVKYTKKNTSDYFIHKDLRGFLGRELDFYIKNEVIRLDELESHPNPKLYLARVRVLRDICERIIEFLAQIEDFQKRLWEKKKFVLRTDYCIALGRVPEEFYEEICANNAQREEWVRLHAINEIQADLVQPGYTEPLTPEFLRAHPTLMLDTRHFPQDFTDRLLASFDDLDEATDGLLVHSENWQALNLLMAKYRGQVKCIYIDPPYNTAEGTFIYKNNYKHSSWAAMMIDRVSAGAHLLEKGGVMEVAIDDTESSLLRMILDVVYGSENYVSTIAAEVNPAGQNLRPNAPARSHDYCHIYANDVNAMEMLHRPLSAEEEALYIERDEKGPFLWDNLRRRGGNSRPIDRPNQWYPLYVNVEQKKVSLTRFDGSTEVWPIDPRGEKRIWRVSPEGAEREIKAGEISVIMKAGRPEVVKKTRKPEGKKPKTLWDEPKYSATTYGTKLLNDIVGPNPFSYPKSVHLVEDCIRFWADESAFVLDFFAGSGTTGHAVINLNREDGGRRRFILVEMGDYFDTVLLPRIKKVVFTPEWKDGKPRRMATPEEAERGPRIVKVIRLEQYEDTLNNIEFMVDGAVQKTLDSLDDYLLRYMLDFETRGSPCRVNVDAFKNPFDYRLRVTDSDNELREERVDLVETFNYLLGIHVRQVKAHRHNGRYYRVVYGQREDETVAIIWRDTEDLDLEADREFIEGTLLRDNKADQIYVNGDSFVRGARPIEPEFKKLMGG